MRAALNPKSGNEKVGPIITWETSSGTCPPTCGQYDRCYAKFHHAKIHWVRLDLGKRGYTFPVFLDRLLELPPGQLARGNQWGDQPGDGTTLNIPAFRALVARVSRFRAWSYTHYPLTPETVRELRSATALGYTVNVSADTLEQAEEKALTGLPVVVTVDPKTEPVSYTPRLGLKVVICPAQTKENVTCKSCGNGVPLCYRPKRKYVIGFRAHGPGARKSLRVVQ